MAVFCFKPITEDAANLLMAVAANKDNMQSHEFVTLFDGFESENLRFIGMTQCEDQIDAETIDAVEKL